MNSSDSDSDSDHGRRANKSKRKPAATRKKAAKTIPSAFLNNSSQLLIPVTQDPSTQDSLYGSVHL